MPWGNYKTITVSQKIYKLLTKLRDQKQKERGVKVSINDVLQEILSEYDRYLEQEVVVNA